MAPYTIPEVSLSSPSHKMPVLGLGTAHYPLVGSEAVRKAVLEAIELGYRHFDTAFLYQTEQPLGEAIAEAVRLGLIKSRDELLITSKLWCSHNHADLVLSALQRTLQAVGAAGCEVLKEIAEAKGKSVAQVILHHTLLPLIIPVREPWKAYQVLVQVCLRWAYEQGVGAILVKSFRKDRMKENLEIFEWGLSHEESRTIGGAIPQSRGNRGEFFVSADGPIKSVEELWDGEL
ncbi:hypothetical protein RJ639_027300 [Escallonia herrerae]|uniref:NADP-dependent oxidoreductase domain-containing protein n=1 Tax=Escallonia herrerae TaxID=1293975 RepID=A0AA88X2E0_9ASTE|nr:hypothetical protein RJ639_027300 [Escallonia herrerae]